MIEALLVVIAAGVGYIIWDLEMLKRAIYDEKNGLSPRLASLETLVIDRRRFGGGGNAHQPN